MKLLLGALEGSALTLAVQAGTVLVAYWLIWLVYSRTFHPLAKVPGPVWASLSRTWLMYRMFRGDYQLAQVALHEKYGPLIRIAPNELSYSKPDGVSLIYRLSRPLEKTDWYHAWKGAGLKSQIDMFTITNEKKHTAYRRVVGAVYSLTSILKNEVQMDQNVAMLLDRLDGFVERKEDVDLGLWLEMYAYDNIGSVFFGKPFGFLETSSDYGGYIAAVHKAMPFLSVVSMAPAYARSILMVIAAVVPSLLRAVLAVDDIRKTAVRETEEAMARKSDDSQRHDMLTRLLDITEKKGEKIEITHHEVTGEMWVAVIAGADSTAGGLRAIIYHILKHPSVMAKLTAEIDSAYANGTLTHPAQHSQVTTLVYLTAVCKEAARVWPSFQVIMPRYAPAQGLQLPNGFFVPAGYRVGINPFVVHRDTGLFGEDAGIFRPERWLEADKEQLRRMNSAILTFGAGTRTCTGQNLAMAEIYKIVPEILRRFTISMPPEKEWTAFNASFNLTSGVVCKIERRGT
ncbi:cytochrome P450 [Macroventuria anomochaeta]|uniref:Cytochrome P450 n=1 Tax=Macroventuria anomochaeta TaxID=301207 RepID=A0ACB6RK13_9PLEO|nr:cytochrome P450 [Macroventuria anomochaeta]KAF2622216.1 cytochrome P450 [Macroventuria anomochaeta]